MGLMLSITICPAAACFPQQTTADKVSPLTIPVALQNYLELSDEQVAKLQYALKSYHQVVITKTDEMHSLQMRAAADPSVNANRGVESAQAEIEKERKRARDGISSVLSSEQTFRLLRLACNRSGDPNLALLATEAANLNLIDKTDRTVKQSFGGTTSIFSNDTGNQPKVPGQTNPTKPLAKRPPPAAPPQ
jgi:hypothetical protein